MPPAENSAPPTTDQACPPANRAAERAPLRFAPNWPCISARWTSSAKTGVGTALSNQSRVWFTLSHGIFNEIYYPRLDQACVRDLGLIVTDGAKFFSEEKRDARHEVEWLAEGVPAFKLINTCGDKRYRIEKQIVTDPQRDTVLQHIRFSAQQGALADYHLHVLLAPHLENHGSGNTAWVGDFEGTPVLFAQRNKCALALACSAPLSRRSAGFVGSSDGWQDLKQHGQMTWEYDRAENGNVALTAEIDLLKSQGNIVLALGFGKTPDDAARNAIASLHDGFEAAKKHYIAGWQDWIKTHATLKQNENHPGDLSRISLAVLRTHESKTAPGGLIASLAIPWGFSKGDNDLGGYHLVWARDMVETAGGLLAAGAHEDVRRVLAFLQKTQLPDGHWSQNMWLDGSPYWNGIQMDETALPILLVDLARREKALAEGDIVKFWPLVKKAASYLVCNGPVSPQDRWEEDPGYTPFTVAAEIAALLAAAELADLNHETNIASYLREVADVWNTNIERWMFVSNTDWCKKYGVAGYYVRIAPKQAASAESRFKADVHIKNVTDDEASRRANHLVSPDALALVRFGLRAADDPRIRDTAKVIDALLKIETPAGPTWHRYNDDGYGEHKDGSPFDGTGVGRGWPLLTGERAHFELAAGRGENAGQLMQTLESFANEGGLIPEQIWDAPDLPERELFFGRPSGSAMPLVWAHAEYLKLRRSLRDGRIFDLPPQTVQRYLKEKIVSPRLSWRFNHKLRSIPPGKILRIETLSPAVIHWSADGWKNIQDAATRDTGLGVHIVDLPTQAVAAGKQIQFTFHWTDAKRWEGADFAVRVGALDSDGGGK
jgi:glucoamylase